MASFLANRFLRPGVGAGISIRLFSISATVIESSDLSRPQLNRESIKSNFAPASQSYQLRKFSSKRVKMVREVDVQDTC